MLTDMIAMRVSPADKKRLAALAKKIPTLKPMSIARAAMRIGLEAIEKNPAILLTRDSDK